MPDRTFGRAPDGPALTLAFAASLAMLATVGEFATLAIRRFVLDRPVHQSIDVLWAKPIVNLVMFAAVAGTILLVRRIAPRLASAGNVVLLLLTLLGPFWTAFPGSRVALGVLALGLAVRLERWSASAGFRQTVKRIALGAAAAVVLVLASMQLRGHRRQRSPVISADAPNVLLIILDTVRAASLHLYGGPNENTPGLTALAQRGVLFEAAIAPSPWTLPTHASLFTGLWPYEHGADWTVPLDERPPVLAEALAARGYRAGAFVANLAYATSEYGLARGFEVYREHDRSLLSLLRTAAIPEWILTATIVRRITGYYDVAGRKSASTINGEFLSWQKGLDTGPWFAFLNYFDAHEPYLPSPPFKGRFSAGLPERRFDALRFWNHEGAIPDRRALSVEDNNAEKAAYEEVIAELDHYVMLLLEELAARDQLRNTLVIVTSDHGEHFGEHGRFTHGNSVYWRSLHVPLIIALPGRVSAPTRVTVPVSLRDLPATIMDLVAPGTPSTFPGRSLLAVTHDSLPADWVLAELSQDPSIEPRSSQDHGGLRTVVSPAWQYIRSGYGREELFRRNGEAADSSVASLAENQLAMDSARSALASFTAGRGARRP